jgi:hypothetical protein
MLAYPVVFVSSAYVRVNTTAEQSPRQSASFASLTPPGGTASR